MSKKQVLVLFSIIFLSSFHFAYADIVISEIMYNPAGTDTNREWVELHNNGTETVNVLSGHASTDWRFDDGSTSLHYINDSLEIPADGYAIITNDKNTFNIEYPNVSLVADTSMTLDNSGNVKIWDGSDPRVLIASYSYSSAQGADNDGNSLQLNGSWCAALPTPGLANVSCDAGGNQNTGGDTNGNNTGGDTSGGNTSGGGSGSTPEKTTTKPKIPEIITIKTKITARNNSFINIPINFKGETSFSNSQNIFSGRYLWNFGDGDSREMLVTNNEKFTHTYFYPGDYTVILEHYPNFFADTPDAIDKINIKIALTAVTISAVGDEKDFFIELTNNSDLDADISAWSISNGIRNFYFPKNTIIPVKKKMKISSRITGFTVDDKSNLKLLSPTNEVVFDYNALPAVKPIIKTVSQTTNNIVKTIENKVDDSLNKNDFQIIDADLSASAINSNESYGVWGLVFWLVLVSGAILSIWILRRRMSSAGVKSAGDDFELIDE
ncbi:MAG: lamin tail domain-containing protein [Candidatus Nomurabacteria bacterium]|nr:lamin tail domain-containing protein [Candidatus Nomurabacteria bacterium]